MQPKRIVYAIDSLSAGGAERQLLYLLTNLERTRFDPYVLTLHAKGEKTHYYDAAVNALKIPLDTLDQPSASYGRLVSVWHYVRYMWRVRPQIVQSCLHDINLIVRFARPFCPPHTLITSERAVYSPRGLRSENVTHWLDDHLIVNGIGVQKQLRENSRRPASKITMIPNALPVEQFETNSDPGLREKLFPGTGFVIGMVARIDPIKDHPTLLKALWLSRSNWPAGLAVFLIGDISAPQVQAQLDRLIEEYDLKEVIQQFPVTSEIAPYYHAADVTILPSISESFPNVVLEAFAAGKPVVISTGANGSGLVEHGHTGWQFPTGEAEALATCLQTVWRTDPETLVRMSEQARAKAAQYSIQATVEEYMKLYERLTQH